VNHDPLCEWSTPCTHMVTGQHERDTENLAVPDATYCWMCGADCHCKLLAKARADEREKAANRITDWIEPRRVTPDQYRLYWELLIVARGEAS